MTIKANEMIRRGFDILTGNAKAEKWPDVVALRYTAAEARARAKEAEERIPAPPPHAGRFSGNARKKPAAVTTQRNVAAKALYDAMDKLVLMGKSLRSMRVFELQKIAASALDTASIADALLAKIGANPDPNALVTDVLSPKQIRKVFADTLGKDVSEYRDESTRPNA